MPPSYRVRGLVRDLSIGGGRRVRANDGIDLDIGDGELFGVLGPNGAGKTTLVRQLMGLLRPDSGSIHLFGHDVVAQPRLAGRIAAYLAQDEPALADLPVSLAVDTTARLRGLSARAARTQTVALLDELGLATVAQRPLVKLSGGQRRLACVASALAGHRRVLVLDEPTTGLDATARRAVWAALRRRREEGGSTILLITHNVAEAEAVLERVAVLQDGRVIACDTPGRLKAAVSDEVRLDLVWRADPPSSDATVAALARVARVDGMRWSTRLPPAEAREALARLTTGAAFAALDDFTLATPSLEDVYLAMGRQARDLEPR